MGNDQDRHRRRRRASRFGPLLLLALVLGAALILAAPAFAHYSGSDVKQCWSCHAGEFTQHKASTVYTLPAYGDLKGHNVNMPQSLTDTGHNTDELLVNDCVTCHSPFSARHQDGTTATQIAELVTPVDNTGSPVGVWSLLAPYTTLSTDPAGLYLPSDHASDTTHAAWEGISCRECHNDANPDANGNPTLSYFDPATYSYVAVPTITPIPSGSPQPDVTWLCDRCHQPNGDDSRNALTPSVHAGLSCADCHGAAPNGQAGFNHNLDAGQKSAPIAQTSCKRCHSGSGAVNAGHPDVTKLATSLTDHAAYGADPASDLQFNAAKWQNIHYITCDTCHHASTTASTYRVVYGNSVTIAGKRSAKSLPAVADARTVTLYAAAKGTTDFGAVRSSTTGGAGSAFRVTGLKLKANATVFVTQAKPLVVDANTLVQSSTFPGLGRGKLVTVFVKVKATLRASATRVRHGRSATLTAMLAPSKAGKKVVIQKSRNGKTWKTWKTVTLASSSSAKATWKAPSAKGKYFFRVSYKGDAANAANASAARKIVVF